MQPGFWKVAGPVAQIDRRAEPSVLGEAVMRCLTASRVGVAFNRDERLQPSELEMHVGARSWGSFMRGTVQVDILADEVGIHVQRDQVRADGYGVTLTGDASEEKLGIAVTHCAREA